VSAEALTPPDAEAVAPLRLVREPDVPSPAAYRAGLVLELLGRRSAPLTLTDVAAHLGLAKSSTANLLTSLEATSMVRRSARGWLLGYKVLELGRAVLVSTEVVAEFHRHASSLPALRGETALLAVLEGAEVIYVARSDGHQPVRVVNDIGSRMPAAVTGLGKAMLSSLQPAALDATLDLVGDPPVLTPRSHRTPAALRADLARSAARGYAVDDGQNTLGVLCVAVPVPGLGTPAAVSATLIARRATPELCARLVADLTVLAARLDRGEQQ